ncbi:MAG: hypothetical protein WC635_12295 [Bacteriovorax sp.]|jgi:hypothetical protein
MRRILFILVASWSLEAGANCELSSWRFHTEGVYKFPDNHDLQIYQTSMRNGGVLFIADIEPVLKKNNFFEKKNGKTGMMNNQSLEGAKVSSHESVRGQLTFLSLKEDLSGLPSEPLALINFKERTILISGEKYLPESELPIEDAKSIPQELLTTLNKTISKKKFKIVEDEVNYTLGKVIKWKTQKLGEKNWKLVQVLTRFSLANKIQIHSREENYKKVDISAIDVWIAFLTIDDKYYWYIGNSSGSPCGESIQAETSKISKEGIAEIGSTLFPLYGQRINGKPDELIYSFGDQNIVYYLKFNEMMVIVVNEIYR